MIAKVAIFFAALAAAHASLLAPAVYGHGLAIKAPVAPVYAAGPLISKTLVAPAPLAYAPLAKAPLAYGYAPLAKAPLAYGYAKAPLAYAPVVKAPVATYTTTYTHAAPVLSHAGLLGAAPLAYAGHGYGLAGHGLAYGPGLAYGHGLTYGKVGYGKVLL